eukprot:1159684-Pelagomonas_calceolata.AAC.10
MSSFSRVSRGAELTSATSGFSSTISASKHIESAGTASSAPSECSLRAADGSNGAGTTTKTTKHTLLSHRRRGCCDKYSFEGPAVQLSAQCAAPCGGGGRFTKMKASHSYQVIECQTVQLSAQRATDNEDGRLMMVMMVMIMMMTMANAESSYAHCKHGGMK